MTSVHGGGVLRTLVLKAMMSLSVPTTYLNIHTSVNCRYLLETLQLFLLQNRVYSVARGAVHGAYVSSVLCWRPPAHDGIAQSSPSQLAWCRSTTNCSSWKMPRWNEKRSTEQRQQAASVHCTIMHFEEIFVWSWTICLNNWWCFDIRPIGRNCSGQCHHVQEVSSTARC